MVKADYQLAALASSQAAFLGHDQVKGLGLSDEMIANRVRSGTWTRVRNGLYKVAGVEGDHKGLLRGAVAILPNATISHESAAEVYSIPYVARGRAVVTVHARTTHEFPGVTIHRSLDLANDHRQPVDAQWTTIPERTLIDLAAVLHPNALANALDESLAQKLVTMDGIVDIFDQVARRGRTGAGAMRQLIDERVGSQVVTATKLEKLGLGVFERGGLPRPVFQYPAPWDPGKRIDFAWPHVCVGCECDSRRWHTRVSDFQRDRDRDNLSLLHNWRIFRFTWEDFTGRPELVVAQLRNAIGC